MTDIIEAIMKASELRDMSDEQLELTLKETAEGLFRLRIQAQTETLNAPSELRRNRRLLARVKTIQRQREIENSKTASDTEPVTENDA